MASRSTSGVTTAVIRAAPNRAPPADIGAALVRLTGRSEALETEREQRGNSAANWPKKPASSKKPSRSIAAGLYFLTLLPVGLLPRHAQQAHG